MSTSIINYNNKCFRANDSRLIIALYYLKKQIPLDIPEWFKKYIKDAIDYTIDIKPIGWADLELDEHFDTFEKKNFFMGLLNTAIRKLEEKHQETDIVSAEEINKILRLQETEGWETKNTIPLQLIIDLLGDIILLLDDSVSPNHKRMNIFQKSHSNE